MFIGRPRKLRRICFSPKADYFKPRGIPLRDLDVARLSFDEAETIRLIDVEGLDQSGAAQKLEISRITVQRIYKSARRKVADALINGKAIKIETSNYVGYCRCSRGRRCGCQNNYLKGGD